MIEEIDNEKKKRRERMRNSTGLILSAVWLMSGCDKNPGTFTQNGVAPTESANTNSDTTTKISVDSNPAPALSRAEPVGPVLTGPQQNAVRSAQNYLNMKGFSKAGLIEQLSSEYGDGYSRADATAAVNSLAVNWNENAARSARDYLDMQGFSCNGLIEQLSSPYGDSYTRSEARYGARQAGAC